MALEGLAVDGADGDDRFDPSLFAYQVAYFSDLLTPWTAMPDFCGSQGLSLPVKGVRFGLMPPLNDVFCCSYDVSFVDGTRVFNVPGPDLAAAPGGASIEAVRVVVYPRDPMPERLSVAKPLAEFISLPPPVISNVSNDETFKLKLLSPGFTTTAPRVKNEHLIPAIYREAMSFAWDHRQVPPLVLRLRSLEHVYIGQDGLVLDKDLTPVVLFGLPYGHDAEEQTRTRVTTLRSQGAIKRITGTSLSCKGRSSSNYGHHLIEMIPRAWIARALFGDTDLKYIVDQNEIMLVVAQTFADLGIAPKSVVWADAEPVFCEQLLVLEGLTNHGQYQSPLCARAVRTLSEGIVPAMHGKIFVRRRARSRPLLNEDFVERTLRGRGFTVVEPGTLPFHDQIALFKGAKVVVGALGAALTNIVFCTPGTTVVALTAGSFPDTFFWFLAQHLDLDYAEVRCPDIDPFKDDEPWNGGFTITETDLADLVTL